MKKNCGGPRLEETMRKGRQKFLIRLSRGLVLRPVGCRRLATREDLDQLDGAAAGAERDGGQSPLG